MKFASWIAVIAAAGFAVSWLGSSVAGVNRDLLVLIYGSVVAGLLGAYFHWRNTSFWKSLTRRWRSGVIGGLAVGVLLTLNVVAQPGAAEAAGVQLAWPVFWLGIVYGLADALLLNVLPVWIVYGEWAGQSKIWHDRLRRAGVALGGSLLVTATYHLGYAEFQGTELLQPLIGNGLITLAFLLTGSPVASIIAHVIMHVAAVLHGIDTTVQLPPHYLTALMSISMPPSPWHSRPAAEALILLASRPEGLRFRSVIVILLARPAIGFYTPR